MYIYIYIYLLANLQQARLHVTESSTYKQI